MPKIRQYTAQVSPLGATRSRRAYASDLGDGGLGQIGKAISGFGAELQKKQEQTELSEVRKVLAQGRAQHTQWMIDSATTMEEGGVGFTDGVSTQLDEWGASARENFKTEAAKDAFEQGYAALRGDLTTRAVGMQAKAYATKQRNDFESALDNSSSVLQLDPTQFSTVHAQTISQIDGLQVDGNTKATMREIVDTKLALSAVRGEISANPSVALERLEAGDWNDYISGSNLKSLLNEADSAIKGLQKDAAVQQSLGYSNLVIDVLNGRAGRPEIEAFRETMLKDLAASGAQSVQLEKLILSVEGDQAKEAAKIQAGNMAYAGVAPLAPTEKNRRDIVDPHYASVAAGWQNRDPNEVVHLNVDYAKRMGVIPSTMRDSIYAGLNSENPQMVIPAAQMLEQLTNANTQFVNQFSDQSISFGQQVLSYTRYGMEPKQAVERAIEIRQIKPDVKDSRRAAYRDITSKDPVANYIQEQIDAGWFEGGLFEADPEINPVITGEFGMLVEREYTLSGDIDVAKKSAFSMLKKTWGVTETDGRKRFMKYAPEMYYGVPGLSVSENASWMREQLVNDVSEGAMLAPGFEDRLILSVHPTAVDPSAPTKPRYAVSIIQEDGTIRALDGSWAPDYSVSSRYTDQQTQADEALNDAMKLRNAREHAAKMRAGEAETLFPRVD